jgi:hypothetical protein
VSAGSRWDSRCRPASIANDFRALAGWFADATGDEDAHLLFQTTSFKRPMAERH